MQVLVKMEESTNNDIVNDHTNNTTHIDHTNHMTTANKVSLEEELNNLRTAFRSLQELHDILQHENENLKIKLQNQENAINENDTSVATAAAAAQLNNYQQALNLCEAQKQHYMAENEQLRAKLAQIGINVENIGNTACMTETTNDPTINIAAGNMLTADSTDDIDDSDENWEFHFNALLKFKETQGHYQVTFEHDVSLAKWIHTQRMIQCSKSMKENRFEKLIAINFFNETMDISTHPNHVTAAGTAVAVAAMDHSGQLDISVAEAEALAAVDAHHNQHHHHHHATSVSVLNPTTTTGLSSRSDEKWEQHYRRLVDYKNTNGNCLVPTSTELGRWLCRQRHNHRYKGLKEDRKIRLMELDSTCLGERLSDLHGTSGDLINGGNSVDPNSHLQSTPQLSTKTKYNLAYESKLHAKWDHYFQQLVSYNNEHGHSNFPTMNGSLGRWISRQRTLYRSQKLKSDRFEKLKSIGFAFEDATALEFKGKLDLQWENMYKQLNEHKERTGHCFDVPEDMPLGKWLYRQRWLYRHGNLREDRSKKLLEIGFEDKKVLKKDLDGGKKRKRKRTSEIEDAKPETIVNQQQQQPPPQQQQQQEIHISEEKGRNENEEGQDQQQQHEMKIRIDKGQDHADPAIPQDDPLAQSDAKKTQNEDTLSLDQMMEESIKEDSTKEDTMKDEQPFV